MFNHLKPTTLAAIVADILEDCSDYSPTRSVEAFCEQAYQQGYELIGKVNFDKLVQEQLDS